MSAPSRPNKSQRKRGRSIPHIVANETQVAASAASVDIVGNSSQSRSTSTITGPDIKTTKKTIATTQSSSSSSTSTPPNSAGYLLTCANVPTKQFIMYLNDMKPAERKFIVHDLDATHVLVTHKSKDEIVTRVQEWLDENVYSAVEKVGEDLDVS